MARVISVFVVPISLLLMGASSASDPWRAWERELSRNCPGRHVEMMGDGGYDDFLAAFYGTLTRAQKRRMTAVADIPNACASETIGFGCEMSRNLFAAQKVGLLPKLVLFGCRTVKCEESALCSQFPRGATY